MTHTVVIKTSNNHRVIMVEDATPYLDQVGVWIDPDLTEVRGIPPHYWKHDGRRHVPMTAEEKLAVDQHHDANGVDNDVSVPGSAKKQKRRDLTPLMWNVLAFALGLTVGILIKYL